MQLGVLSREAVVWNIEIIKKNVIANIRHGYQQVCRMMTENAGFILGGLRVRALVISCAAFETRFPPSSPHTSLRI